MLSAHAPTDPHLREIFTSLHGDPTYAHSNEVSADQHASIRSWEVTPQNTYGYRHFQLVENMWGPSAETIDDTNLNHAWRMAAAQAALGRSSIGPIMREAGLFTEVTVTHQRQYKITNFHTAYPLTETFVSAINPALSRRNRNLCFATFNGDVFTAQHLTESVAAKNLTVPIGTSPHQNEHDILTHGLAWLALSGEPLAQTYLAPIQKLARAAVAASGLAGNNDECVEFGNTVEGNLNAIWIAMPHKRKINFGNLATLAQVRRETVVDDIHKHLYPGQKPEEAYLM